MNLQLFGNGGDREQELRNAMLQSLTETTNQLASTLYTHTWKTRTTPDGNQIISLRASQAKRAAGFSPWEKTPQASDGEGGVMEIQEGSAGKYKLRDFAALASWPTPQTHDVTTRGNTEADGHTKPHDLSNMAELASWPTPVAEPANGTPEAFLERKRRSVAKTGRSMGIVLTDLAMVSQLAAWPTPRTSDTVNTNETPEQWAEREREMKAKNPNLGGLHKPLGIVSKLAAWPTPMNVPDSEASHGQQSGQYRKQMDDLIGWTTPSSRDWKDSAGMATTGTNPDGTERERLDQLPRQANLASWPTPQAFDASNGGEGRALRYKGNAPSEAGNTRNPETPGSYRGDLKDYAAMAAWPTPNAMEGGQTSRSGERRDEMLMGGMVKPSPEGPARLLANGQIVTGYSVGTTGGGQLAPALPRWLQALPVAWCVAAIAAHRKMKSAKKKPTPRPKRG